MTGQTVTHQIYVHNYTGYTTTEVIVFVRQLPPTVPIQFTLGGVAMTGTTWGGANATYSIRVPIGNYNFAIKGGSPAEPVQLQGHVVLQQVSVHPVPAYRDAAANQYAGAHRDTAANQHAGAHRDTAAHIDPIANTDVDAAADRHGDQHTCTHHHAITNRTADVDADTHGAADCDIDTIADIDAVADSHPDGFAHCDTRPATG